MSCMINMLYLTGSVFMLEIYDRVHAEPQRPDAGRLW